MRQARHRKICELIAEHNIETQEDLAAYLRKSGFEVTQATVSRDIKALKLVKSLSKDGTSYRYSLSGEDPIENVATNDMQFFLNMVVSIVPASNILVIKTVRGAASIVSHVIESMSIPEMIGDIAGYDTIFIATPDDRSARVLKERLECISTGSEEEE